MGDKGAGKHRRQPRRELGTPLSCLRNIDYANEEEERWGEVTETHAEISPFILRQETGGHC